MRDDERLQLVTVPGGHIVMWDAFDETADAILGFLDGRACVTRLRHDQVERDVVRRVSVEVVGLDLELAGGAVASRADDHHEPVGVGELEVLGGGRRHCARIDAGSRSQAVDAVVHARDRGEVLRFGP